MEKIVLFIGITVALSYVGGIIVACKNLKKSEASYLPYEEGPEWLKICGAFMVNEKSVRRKNNGDDPCKVTKSILYIDYVDDLDMLTEE